MLFHPRLQGYMNKPIITYNNTVISYMSSKKVLGIDIIDNLTWHDHIRKLCKDLNKSYYIIKCLKDVVSAGIIKIIYFAYFQSKMKCGMIFWVTDSYSKKICLQKLVIQLMYGIKRCA
jgi:hypothetical protein